jgi:hypothetical protein
MNSLISQSDKSLRRDMACCTLQRRSQRPLCCVDWRQETSVVGLSCDVAERKKKKSQTGDLRRPGVIAWPSKQSTKECAMSLRVGSTGVVLVAALEWP